MKLWKRTKDIVDKTLIGILSIHAATQVSFWGNDLYHKLWPSSVRVEFEEQTGFPIKGWAGDIEDRKNNIGTLVETIVRETTESPFELTSIRIESDNYFKTNILDQVGRVVSAGYSGAYFPGLSKIFLRASATHKTLHHEIKHAKAFALLKEHPEFRERWEALSTDEHGRSLYLDTGEQTCMRIRGLGWLLEDEKLDDRLNERLGFVSTYARTNFHEDVAEVGELVEWDDSQLFDWVHGSERNERIAAKIALAEEYGLIPAGFSEYLTVKNLNKNMFGTRGSWLISNIDPFLTASAAYLEKYPGSIYESDMRRIRGQAMVVASKAPDSHFGLEQAEAEFMMGLNASFKDFTGYLLTLEELGKLNRRQGDVARAKIFDRAEKLFYDRFHNGDLRLPTRGVNDFLRENGVL